MNQLATRFGRVNYARAPYPLSDHEIREVAPSVFAEGKHGSRSDRYTHIPTSEVLAGLRREGFQPFMVCQAKVRAGDRIGYAKHMIRLRHAGQIEGEEANEIVLINSHDGTSSYQMLAGVFRFVCQNGMVVGETVDDLRIPHRGDVVGQVIEGAWRVLDDFERVDASRQTMKATNLERGEQIAFARAAMQLRWEDSDQAPVTEGQVIVPRRAADLSSDLWSTFNVVQENLVRGGLHGHNKKRKRVTTRPIQGIDGNIALNRALWTLAEEMQRLKAA